VSRFVAWRYRAESVLAGGVRRVVPLVPMAAVRTFGGAVGLLAYLLDGRRRRTALENLEHAFPGRTIDARRALVRTMFSHFGALLFELIKFDSYSREQMLAATEVEGEERLRQAQAQGRGILIFTGHFGYWELLAMAHALRMPPMTVLARPLDNPSLHTALEDIRTSTGNAVIYRQGAVRRILRSLGRGGIVGVLIDQHLHSTDAVDVDFFGRPAATTSALAALALRTGAPVIPVFALPLPGGRYRFVYEHPVDPPQADTPDAVREFTQRCTDVLEMYVRRHPELWMWMHRRWREREVPAHEAPPSETSDAEVDV
jgi:Kdo2-lipid IVA lauroyltransferase/acyltransferase